VVTGVGLFDPARFVALEIALTSVSTFRSGFGDKMTVSLKAHRSLSETMAVAVGFENALQLGNIGDGGQSAYVALGKVFVLASPTSPLSQITLTGGFGNGRFRTEDQIRADEAALGVFAGVSLRVLPRVSTMVEWTGQDMALGLSVAPFDRFPIVLTPALVDVAGTAGDGVRFSLGVGFGTGF
jgi:hypothetical protein